MHQDQRVGLALGVLLVGACAAFFFRNETQTTAHTPQLQHAQELDDRIAERAIRPNLKGIQAVETADKRYANPTIDPAHSLDEQDDAFLSRHGSADGSFSGSKGPRFHRPSQRSVDDGNDIPEMAPIVVRGDSSGAGNLASPPDSSLTANHGRSKSLDEAHTYVVQKGDSLSSIAAKTLGSSHRFQELFDANHDQLSDPNDVKVGMTLRIPGGTVGTAAKPQGNKARGTVSNESEPFYTPTDTLRDAAGPSLDSELSAPRQDAPSLLMPPDLPNQKYDPPALPDSSDETTAPKKFQPARRIPLPGRPVGPQAKNSEQSGRKLSQASLESTSGKIAR